MPAVSADFTLTFFVKFTDACGNESNWWRGCGLITAQSDVQPYQHAGCFSDRFSDPDFTPLATFTSVASLEECHTHCQAAGSAFFAMQAAKCRCTNSYGRHGQLSDSNCDYTGATGCRVNGNTCGGYSRNSIYTAIGTTDFGLSVSGGKIIMGVNTIAPTAGQALSIVSPSSYNDGQWHQVIAAREQSSADYWLIIDGVEVGRLRGNAGALSGPTSVTLGRARADLGGQFFSGSMRAIHFFSLSSLASSLVASPPVPPPPPLAPAAVNAPCPPSPLTTTGFATTSVSSTALATATFAAAVATGRGHRDRACQGGHFGAQGRRDRRGVCGSRRLGRGELAPGAAVLLAGMLAHRHGDGRQRDPHRRRHGYHRGWGEPSRVGRGSLADEAPRCDEQRVGRYH
jgi:hypothetical protein